MEQVQIASTSEIDLVIAQIKALVYEEDQICALANVSAYLNEILPDINWVGFYIMKNGQLVLGPFQGKVACTRIQVGKGVCGTAVSTKLTQRIDDVHHFPGHIACDSASNSELVVPIFSNNEVVAVLDIDSPLFSRFTEEDQKCMEEVAEVLSVLF